MPHSFSRVAVVGATGPTGIHLTRELTGRGIAVRVISRSRERLTAAFAGLDVEVTSADALDPAALGGAVKGSELLVDAIGLPADRMADHPRTARAVVSAARAAGARLVQVSSYWSYLPAHRLPLDEEHPRMGGNRYIELRREAEDILEEAGALVVQLPDFFGPEVHTSTVQMALEQAADGRPMGWIGGARVRRDYAYVPDAMRLVAELIERDEAFGRRVLLPGCGPLDAESLAKLAGRALGRPVKLRAAPLWLLRILALASRDLRAFLPMLPYYAQPLSFDVGRLRGLVGEVQTTPYEEAIPATVEWIARKG